MTVVIDKRDENNVTWNKAKRGWQVYITVAGRAHFIGRFRDEDEAGAAAAAWRAEHMPFSAEALCSPREAL